MSKLVNNQTVTRIVDDPDKCVDEIPTTNGGILARIFRRFLIIGNVTRMRWNRYMDAYVKDVESGKAGIRSNLISVRGNTTKFLADDSFTWENFIKSMRFLQTKRLKITIEREDVLGRKQTVEEIISFETFAEPVDNSDVASVKGKD